MNYTSKLILALVDIKMKTTIFFLKKYGYLSLDLFLFNLS